MNDLVVLAASAGGVVLMIGAALALGFRKRARIDADMLAGLAAGENARAEASLVDARGSAGVARLADGKWLVARVMADGVGVRVFAPGAVHVRAARAGWKLSFDDIGYPALDLRLSEPAPAWLSGMSA